MFYGGVCLNGSATNLATTPKGPFFHLCNEPISDEYKLFKTTRELLAAVTQYFTGDDDSWQTIFGKTIGDLRVDNIEDFSLLFSAYNGLDYSNENARTFNDDISRWNTSKAKNTSGIFTSARAFN
jgi:Mycoplasma protein of unknown function, DUF285